MIYDPYFYYHTVSLFDDVFARSTGVTQMFVNIELIRRAVAGFSHGIYDSVTPYNQMWALEFSDWLIENRCKDILVKKDTYFLHEEYYHIVHRITIRFKFNSEKEMVMFKLRWIE